MQLALYTSYKDEKGRDISVKESILYIKIIFKRYRRLLILNFLSYVAKEIGLIASFDKSVELQYKLFKYKNSDSVLIHNRAVLVLFQVFFETTDFDENNTEEKIRNDEEISLFLYANQILNKTDTAGLKGSEIRIEHLMVMMKLYVGTINAYELNLTHDYFLEFYIKLLSSEKSTEYNEVLKKQTGLTIDDFISILKELKNSKLKDPFKLYEKIGLLEYDEIYEKWENRVPKIALPSDYRFFEQYPLIKKDDLYYGTSVISLFSSIIRKPYHILSSDPESKNSFRGFWGKYIVEPTIKEYVKKIFSSNGIRVIDIDFQKLIGFEISDLVIVHENDVYLLEIKSGYMGLEDRYTDDIDKFRTAFEKKYVYSSTGKHQLLNQIDMFEKNFGKLSKLCELNENTRYRVFSGSIVFDEALSMLGFKRYLGNSFNKIMSPKVQSYKNFLPFLYSNLLTFAELISIGRRIKNIEKRIHILKATFNYQDSLYDFLEDIKEKKIAVDGIAIEDID
jgi:hypothetical protein